MVRTPKWGPEVPPLVDVPEGRTAWALWAGLIAACLVVAFAAVVWRLRPKHRANRATAAFFSLFGLSLFAHHLAVLQSGSAFAERLQIAGAVASVGGAMAVVRLCMIFPKIDAPAGATRPATWLAAILIPFYVLALVLHTAPSAGKAVIIANVIWALSAPAYWYAAFRCALVFPYLRRRDLELRRSLLLTAAAITLHVTQIGTMAWLHGPLLLHGRRHDEIETLVLVGLSTILPLALFGTWLSSAQGPAGRGARRMAIVSLLGPTVTVLLWAARFPLGGGITSVIMVLLLSYALLRRRVLNLDDRMRWSISRGALAAVFVGAFYLIPKVAQETLGSRLHSDLLGIAAGAIVIVAIVPLKRATDRLAATAIPRPGVGPYNLRPREAAFVSVIRAAYRSPGSVKRKEWHLAEVAECLDLGPKRVVELRSLVEEAWPNNGSQSDIGPLPELTK